jgi:hypothetical protein
VVVVVVELDAVLLGERGVLVVFGLRSAERSPNPRSKAPGPDCLSFRASSKRR